MHNLRTREDLVLLVLVLQVGNPTLSRSPVLRLPRELGRDTRSDQPEHEGREV